jgi:hypothetical protein
MDMQALMAALLGTRSASAEPQLTDEEKEMQAARMGTMAFKFNSNPTSTMPIPIVPQMSILPNVDAKIEKMKLTTVDIDKFIKDHMYDPTYVFPKISASAKMAYGNRSGGSGGTMRIGMSKGQQAALRKKLELENEGLG